MLPTGCTPAAPPVPVEPPLPLLLLVEPAPPLPLLVVELPLLFELVPLVLLELAVVPLEDDALDAPAPAFFALEPPHATASMAAAPMPVTVTASGGVRSAFTDRASGRLK
jgi:hypothetical protein